MKVRSWRDSCLSITVSYLDGLYLGWNEDVYEFEAGTTCRVKMRMRGFAKIRMYIYLMGKTLDPDGYLFTSYLISGLI